MLFALIGNQNCGKTTLFNQLTGLNLHVGNFPGVTVEKKESKIRGRENDTVVDLPGIYSLSPYTSDEAVVRSFLSEEKPDCIINIVDATNIERNLYLTTQLLELGIPMVIALNMMDELDGNGICVKLDTLRGELGVPVVAISASKNQGLDKLIKTAVSTAIAGECGEYKGGSTADERYNYIGELCALAVSKPKMSRAHERSVKIDRLLTHKWFGIPILVGIMLAIFWVTFGVAGGILSDWLASAIALLSCAADNALRGLNVSPMLGSLVVDGVIGGVGSVLSFVPTVVCMFFFLSLLEDSGYMARAAFITDRIFANIGLSGRSFVPLFMGFGCTVPAIMAARTLPGERSRKITILLLPFISCSAKLPIYAMLASAFFSGHRASIMLGLYILGIAVGIISAVILEKTLFSKCSEPFIMELPNYRMPSVKSVMRLLWDKTRDFLSRAFTVIFIASVVIWVLQSFDAGLRPVQDGGRSILAGIGRVIAPVFAPLGFGDWRAASALICGFSAKEAVVSTLAVLCGGGEMLCSIFTPASAVSFLVFTLLYSPCIAAINTVRTELGGKYALGMVLYQTGIAWLAGALAYRIALFL